MAVFELSSFLGDSFNQLSESFVKNGPRVIISIIILVGSIYISRVTKESIIKRFRFFRNKTLINLLSNLLSFAIIIIGLFVILKIFNLDKAITSILAGAGVVGLAIGLALQDPLMNLFSGIIMSIKSYYKEGDLIESQGVLGHILRIDLRTTVILKTDGQEVIVPNKLVLQNPLVNYSNSGIRRIQIPCGISYHDNLETTKKVLLDAFNDEIEMLESKPVQVNFVKFGTSSIDFEVWYWVKPSDFIDARDKGIRLIKKTLDKNGLNIPFPIQTIDFSMMPKNGIAPATTASR